MATLKCQNETQIHYDCEVREMLPDGTRDSKPQFNLLSIVLQAYRIYILYSICLSVIFFYYEIRPGRFLYVWQ